MRCHGVGLFSQMAHSGTDMGVLCPDPL